MNNAKIIYLFALAVVVIVILLFMDEVLPVALIVPSPETKYVIDLASIVTGVGGLFTLLYCFRFVPIRQRVENGNEEFVVKICTARIIVWLILMLINVVLYFEAMGVATNPKYAIIFLAIAYIFCWPTLPASDRNEKSTKPSAPTIDNKKQQNLNIRS